MSSSCPTFAFTAQLFPRPGSEELALHSLERDWLAFLATRGLQTRAHASVALHFVITSEAAQATDADRAAVEIWLGERRELGHWTVSALADLQED